MVYLLPDTANQSAFFTLDEGRALFVSAFTHYLMLLWKEDNAVERTCDLAQVLQIANETNRVTEVICTTEGLNNGRYKYEIYGQNSDSNLDPNDTSVVGLVEKGVLQISDGSTIFVSNGITIAADRG